jgi:tetratricopeptide (TPR) repeat protein
VLAAGEALALHDTGSASTLLGVAARHAPSPAALASVRVRLAELAQAAGHYEDAETFCALALNWYEGEADPRESIRLKRMRILVRSRRGHGARETLDALFALVDEATLAGADAERASILLVASQMLGRLGEPREAQRVAEQCVEIAERCGDLVLLCDSYNRLGLSLLTSDPSRARELFARALDLVVPMGDVLRRVRVLHNIGLLESSASRWVEAKRSLESAVEFARTAGLVDLWALASLNLGALLIRMGIFEGAREALNEALRLSAEVQQTEVQLISTYNLGHLARELENYERASDTYQLVIELAERIGQSEVQAGALAGRALCCLALGDVPEAVRHHDLLAPIISTQPEWFQGRELVEALPIHLALLDDRDRAYELFRRALALAEASDAYGAIWLIAEFCSLLAADAPEEIEQAIARSASRPEVIENPFLRERFGVLNLDTGKTVDRS